MTRILTLGSMVGLAYATLVLGLWYFILSGSNHSPAPQDPEIEALQRQIGVANVMAQKAASGAAVALQVALSADQQEAKLVVKVKQLTTRLDHCCHCCESPFSVAEIWDAQAMLNGIGLRSGWCDGIQGQVFQKAVVHFQKVIGAATDGTLTRAEFRQLLMQRPIPQCDCHIGDYCDPARGIFAH